MLLVVVASQSTTARRHLFRPPAADGPRPGVGTPLCGRAPSPRMTATPPTTAVDERGMPCPHRCATSSCSTSPRCRRSWYNIVPDLPEPPPPPLHPGTLQPVGPDDLAPLFPMELILQEVSDRAVHRHPRGGARRLPAVAALAAVPGAPAGEGARHARPGSTTSTRASPRPARTSRTPPCRRPTTTPRPGVRKLTTETGAGQWGTALAFACAQFGLECEVWQVRRLLRRRSRTGGS